MTMVKQIKVFDKSGIAALSDLESQEWKATYAHLEAEQSKFLAKEEEFRSEEYKWPRDPLHNWSRVWEYPYVFYHLLMWNKMWNNKNKYPHVVDVGSGVTFFPFAVARLGCDVTCTDIDPIAEKDLQNAIKCTDTKPGKVDFCLSDGAKLPFLEGEIDAMYCVSVLEHIPTYEQTITEMARVLAPGGLLILTIDLCIRGEGEINKENYINLICCLQEHFSYVYNDVTVHPDDVLHNHSGPYSNAKNKKLGDIGWYYFRQAVKPFFGRRPRIWANLPSLTVQGFVLKKLDK
jgi:ubiquinone/menaquinone biosynthesis C-methylase UbiE